MRQISDSTNQPALAGFFIGGVMPADSKLIQTYVFRKDKAFFVSTINRDSSSMLGGRYAETMVWEWNAEKRERGAFVYQAEASEGSIRKHQEIVVRLHEGDDLEEEA